LYIDALAITELSISWNKVFPIRSKGSPPETFSTRIFFVRMYVLSEGLIRKSCGLITLICFPKRTSNKILNAVSVPLVE